MKFHPLSKGIINKLRPIRDGITIQHKKDFQFSAVVPENQTKKLYNIIEKNEIK